MDKIVFATEELAPLLQIVKDYSSCAVISDCSVAALYGKALIEKLAFQKTPIHLITIPAGEKSKTLELAGYCWQQMHELGLDRRSVVIGFGGGVITDLAGFVAGCYMRGIEIMHIPTTLMGMVDAAIGGKTGVNLSSGKNLIGVIHQPKSIFIGKHYLATLPQREFCAGLAEVIKYGVIWDPDFFDYLESSMPFILKRDPEKLHFIIAQSTKIKSHVVGCDEKEQNLRSILNWGHTFAHAIESLTKYDKYLHGEAVAIGMHCAAKVSCHLGYVGNDFVQRQNALCQAVGLPTSLPPDIAIQDLIGRMCQDKKSISGKISLIVAKQIGKVVKVSDVDPMSIQQALTITE